MRHRNKADRILPTPSQHPCPAEIWPAHLHTQLLALLQAPASRIQLNAQFLIVAANLNNDNHAALQTGACSTPLSTPYFELQASWPRVWSWKHSVPGLGCQGG